MADYDESRLTVVDHPLVQHKLHILRDKTTTTKQFRELVNELAILESYEAMRDFPLEDVEVETPLETMTADKVPGIRATPVQTVQFAELAREHNNANVIGLSGRFTDLAVNEAIVDTFLSTEFAGGRHAGRVEKIMREDDPNFKGVDAE